jgi:hypothetical protein
MTAELLSPPNGARADLFALSEPNVPALAAFIGSQSGQRKETVQSHLRWFLLQNPARQPADPLGFALRSEDKIVACILCSPQSFQVLHRSMNLMGSSSFYVAENFRGQGGRIFLQYARLGQLQPLFGTSANAAAAALWKAAGACPIPCSEGELFGVFRWSPLAEEFAHRKSSSRILRHIARSSAARLVGLFHPLKIDMTDSSEMRILNSAEEALEIASHAPSEKITSLRDMPYLRWRYFSGHDPTAALFSCSHLSTGRSVMVAVNQRPRGYRGQISTLNVLDVFPEVCPEDWLKIAGALAAHYRQRIDALVLRNQSLRNRERLIARGFLWRAFDAPTGWLLDKAKRLPSHDRYFVPADGDSLI